MSAPAKPLGFLAWIACAATISIVAPLPLHAQLTPPGGKGGGPADVAINPSGGTFVSALLNVTVTWCDQPPQPDPDPSGDPTMRSDSRFYLNGVDVSANFGNGGPDPCAEFNGTITLDAGENTFRVYACDSTGCNNTYAFYTFNDTPPPILSTAPHNGDYINTALCAADCFDVVATYSTPAYVSLDEPRSLALYYSSAQASPLPLVQVDATHPAANPNPPDRMSIRLKDASGAWVTFINGLNEIHFESGAGTTRLAAKFNATSLATGAYTYTVVVRSHWDSDGSMAEAPPETIRVLVVNEQDSPIALGWSIAGWQQLHLQGDGSVVITEGDGSIAYFDLTSCSPGCTFSSPAGDFTTLSGSSSAGWIRAYPDGTTVHFSGPGRLASIDDRFGNTSTFVYDGGGRPWYVSDPASKTITLAYGAYGASYVSDGTRTSTINVNSNRKLTYIDDPLGRRALTIGWSGARPSFVTARGVRTDYTYSRGKLRTATGPEIQLVGGPHRPRSVFSALEMTLVPTSSAQGTASNPMPRATPEVFASVKNPRNRTTQFLLDRFGAARRIIEPLARTTVLNRNGHSQVTTLTRPSGHTINYSWSGPNLTKMTDVTTGREINYEYNNPFHQLTRSWGDVTSAWYTYSSDGKRLEQMALGDSTALIAYTSDSRGRVTAITDPEGHATTFHYSWTVGGFQNTDSIVTERGRTQYFYDSHGRLSATRNALDQIDSVYYNVLNQTVRTVGRSSENTFFEYDALQRLISVQDAVSNLHQFSYNDAGWVTGETDPFNNTQSYLHDENGNVRTLTNRRGQVTHFTYDALDQLATRVAAGDTATYWFDPDQRMVLAQNHVSADTVRFDIAGRVTSQSSVRSTGLYRIEYSHDDRGRRTKMKVMTPGAAADSVRYQYNAFGALQVLRGFDDQATWHGYNLDGQRETTSYPNGIGVTRDLLDTHGSAEIRYAGDGGAIDAILGQLIHNDSLGRVNEITTVAQDTTRQLEYDASGRLTGYEDYKNPSCFKFFSGWHCFGSAELVGSASYSYDAIGNRTDSGAQLDRYRLTSFDGYSLGYDLDGNLVSKSGNGISQTHTWNALGQLTSVTQGGATTSFAYDALGRRVATSTGSGTTGYIYDGGNLVLELNSSGSPTIKYAHYPGLDRPHSMRQGSNTYYFATNVSGSVAGVIDGAKSLRNHYAYEPFGAAEHPSEQVPNRLGFHGAHLDPQTGLYYLRARYYDPSIARFISEDPIGLAGGINPYAFAANNPINFRDPRGMNPECEDTPDTEKCPVIPLGDIFASVKRYPDAPEVTFDPWFDSITPWVMEGISEVVGIVGSVLRKVTSPCGRSVINAGVTVAFDAGVGAGLARAAGYGIKSVGHMAVRSMKDSGIILSTTAKSSGAASASASSMMAGIAGGQSRQALAGAYSIDTFGATGTWAAAGGPVLTGNISGWDFVPLVASFRAIRGVAQACTN